MSKHILRKRLSGFTTVSNNVIKVLKGDLECLGLYLYLLSLPNDWEFYKTQLCKECSMGINKLNGLLKKLCAFGLVDFAQVRDAQGRFSRFYLTIYDTETIKNKDLDQSAQPECQNDRPVETVKPSQEATKEVLTKEVLQSTNKSYYASDDAHSIHFDSFWNIYPRKKDKARAKEIWKRKKYDDISSIIVSDVESRILNEAQWKDERFIPHPSTYLRNKRWDDELTLVKVIPNKETGMERAVRLCLN